MPTYNDVDAAIRATAARAGMSPAEWKAIASIESSLTPYSNARNEGTQYKGLFQIGTRDRPGEPSEWTRHGQGDVYNAMDNANAAAALAAENNAGFQKAFGRAPTPIETYMMHQQGLGFFTRGALTNVAGNLPPEDRTPENMTHNGLMAYYARKMANRANAFRDPDDPNEISYSYAGPYAGGGGGGGGGGSGSGATASAQGGQGGGQGDQTDQGTQDTGPDFATQMGAIRDKIAQQDQANQMQQMQPLQMPQAITPGMLRARQLAQAMLSLQQQKAGVTPPGVPGIDQSGGSAT